MSKSEGEGEEEGRGRSTPERLAYYQVATTSGVIRRVAISRRIAGRDRTLLRDARRRLRALPHTDKELIALRARLVADLDRLLSVPRGQPPGRRLARSVLRRSTAVNTALRSYARGHPEVGGAVPD